MQPDFCVSTTLAKCLPMGKIYLQLVAQEAALWRPKSVKVG
ncbi:hypothetical protein [Gloeobacter morelensis]|nr:hypothetical protein [Gloeobacter morelensis]